MMGEQISAEQAGPGLRAVGAVRQWFTRNRYALVIVAGLLALWHVVAVRDPRGNIFFPTPEFVVRQTLANWNTVVAAFQVTVSEVLIGFAIAVLVGVVFGIVVAEYTVVSQVFFPVVIVGYAMPHAVLAPIFLVWFGNNLVGASLFVAWVAFFVVLVNTITGMNQVREEFEDLGGALGASKWQLIRKVKFWEALPHIVNGIKIAALQSVVAAIIIEFLGSQKGLGWHIVNAGELSKTGLLFGVLIVIMVFALVFYKLVGVVLELATPATMDVGD